MLKTRKITHGFLNDCYFILWEGGILQETLSKQLITKYKSHYSGSRANSIFLKIPVKDKIHWSCDRGILLQNTTQAEIVS